MGAGGGCWNAVAVKGMVGTCDSLRCGAFCYAIS